MSGPVYALADLSAQLCDLRTDRLFIHHPIIAHRGGLVATLTWYLGSIGNLVQIPAPARPAEVEHALIGGVHTSLGGAVTVDRSATSPRAWRFEWPYLTEDQLTYLEAVGQGLVKGPLRLIDPARRNRLPRRIATAGSLHRSASDFVQSVGNAPTWVAVADPPSTVPVRGAISWQRTATTAGSLTPASSADRVPVVVGEQLRASIWVRNATIQAAAAIDAWDSAGSSSRTTGTATTLSASTWTQLTVTYTVAAGRVSASPALVVANGQAASTLHATGWQISLQSEPTTWTLGGGTPVVAASELSQSYSLFDVVRLGWQMTLRESVV